MMGQVQEMETGRNVRSRQQDCAREVSCFLVHVERIK